MDSKKFNKKHSEFQLIQKGLLILFSIFLIYTAYPCLNTGGFSECFVFSIGNFFYLIALLLILLFLKTFLRDNWIKVVYYLSEFLLVIFGIYGVIIIQKAIQSTLSWKFTLFNLILIFIIAAVLLDFRELFKDLLDSE